MHVDETTIRQWADRHECRRYLPILIRRLVRETTPSLISLRFPGNEAVDLAGLDGQVDADSQTTWVPQGRSVWEMGCDQRPGGKADSDYAKRTSNAPSSELARSSFVFVTPRRWNNKDDWLAERRQEGTWRSVLAYDAIDLETWLEEAPATSRWLGELLGIAAPGLLTPQEWWTQWSTASTPPISMAMVVARKHGEANALISKLRKDESVVPIQADDRGEAVAFAAATLVQNDAIDLLDRTLVVTSSSIQVPSTTSRLIVIPDLPEGEEPSFGDRRNLTLIRPYSRGRVDIRDSIQLSHVPSKILRTELEAAGFAEDDARRLARETGHSLPVLRRRLSPDPEVRRPVWAMDHASAKRLLPFALAGSWIERKKYDDETVLQLIGELSSGEVLSVRDSLVAMNDAPIARYGNVNVVVSQLDALFSIGPFIEIDDLDRFFQLVPELLGDRDPALDLPQDQWWMASVLEKERSCSHAILSGLGDALCILAIHGKEICGSRLDLDCAYRAGQVVQSLMQDADEDRWLTIRAHLRALAEASPNAFLDCLEDELSKPEPAIRAIMGTTGGGVGGECLRTNLLWALELLAWDSSRFSRVAGIVFGLRRLEVDDNWSNSPEATARSLFLAWLPATSLSVPKKMAVLRDLSEDHRGPAIDVCISLLPGGFPQFASKTATPQWLPLEANVPEPTNKDVREAAIGASRLLLDLLPFDKTELDKLLEVSTRLHPDDLRRLVNEVERWAADADDEDKADLRHNLRRRSVADAYQEGSEDKELADGLRRMEAALEPDDPAARHKWLFENAFIEWQALAEGETEEQLSWEEKHALFEERRRQAIVEIQDRSGDEAAFSFALSVKQPDLVARVLVPPDASVETVTRWARIALLEEPSEAADAFLRQVLWNAGSSVLNAVSLRLTDQGLLETQGNRQRIAKHLPGTDVGWAAAEALGDDIVSVFWKSVTIRLWNDTPGQHIAYAINKLLEHQRPRSAFAAIEIWPDRLPTEQWVRILKAVAIGQEPDGPLPSAYHLDEVFKCLDSADDVSQDQVANLELPFIPLLCAHGHRSHERTLAIHRELARDPALFVQLICWHYRRRDGADDPEDEGVPADQREFLAELAYHTLEGWSEVPGQLEDGDVDERAFTSWAEDALSRAAQVDRREAAERHLGALLARLARRRSWNEWLPVSVLDFLDRPENGELRRRFDVGVYNARGVTSRGPYDGGDQERSLERRYRELAERYRSSHPRVSAMLISIAEGYEREARRHDESAAVGERWHP